MTRTMKTDAPAYRLVTKHVTTGEEKIFGPYGTIGAVKSAARRECFVDDYSEQYWLGKKVQTRQFIIEKTVVQWETVPVSLVDGEWVEN